MGMMSFLSALSGAMIAVMILMNGQLSGVWGSWAAAVVIHAVGLMVILPWMLIRREKPFVRSRMPPALYLGGAVGVLTTVCANITVPAIGVSATIALGLLGQTAASALLDGLGWLGARKARFRRETALDGLAIPLHPGAARYYEQQGQTRSAPPQ